jgi:hypothetical protein
MSFKITCEYCGLEYLAVRSSRKYCCDSHKTMASRRRIEEIKAEQLRYEQEMEQARLTEIKDTEDRRLKKIRDEENRKLLEQVQLEQSKRFEDFQADLKKESEIKEKERRERAEVEAKLRKSKKAIDDAKKRLASNKRKSEEEAQLTLIKTGFDVLDTIIKGVKAKKNEKSG